MKASPDIPLRTMNKSGSVRLKPVVGTVVIGVLMLSACGEFGGSGQEEEEVSVELGPGETREEQIDEIGVVVGLLESHIGDGLVLRAESTDEWTPEYHAEHRRPTADCPGEDQYRNEVFFYHRDISFEDAYSAAEKIADELGFTPNDAVNDTGAGSSRMMFSAQSEDGRTFIVRESASEDENVEVVYNTRCTDHESNREARDEFMLKEREERQRERDEQ